MKELTRETGNELGRSCKVNEEEFMEVTGNGIKKELGKGWKEPTNSLEEISQKCLGTWPVSAASRD